MVCEIKAVWRVYVLSDGIGVVCVLTHAISPSGDCLVITQGPLLDVFDLSTGEPISSLTCPYSIIDSFTLPSESLSTESAVLPDYLTVSRLAF